ncbi:MAG: hypothetical protein U1E52_14045 [Geminicoccaceae bacterium]
MAWQPGTHLRSLAWAVSVLVALQLAPAVAKEPAAPPADSYARAFYDVALVQNCGLLTAEVERGFELVSAERRAAEGLDDAAARVGRIQAGVAFDLEYQNRGLGGSRPWCRQDGKAAALAFFARFIDERYRLPRSAPRRRPGRRPRRWSSQSS